MIQPFILSDVMWGWSLCENSWPKTDQRKRAWEGLYGVMVLVPWLSARTGSACGNLISTRTTLVREEGQTKARLDPSQHARRDEGRLGRREASPGHQEPPRLQKQDSSVKGAVAAHFGSIF